MLQKDCSKNPLRVTALQVAPSSPGSLLARSSLQIRAAQRWKWQADSAKRRDCSNEQKICWCSLQEKGWLKWTGGDFSRAVWRAGGPDSIAIAIKYLLLAPSLSLTGKNSKRRCRPGPASPLLAALAPHEVAVGWRETPRRGGRRGRRGERRSGCRGQRVSLKTPPWEPARPRRSRCGPWGGLSTVLPPTLGCVGGGRAPRCVSSRSHPCLWERVEVRPGQPEIPSGSVGCVRTGT